MSPLQRLLAYYAEQGRTIDSITHLCGRTRKTLIKHARRANIKFPDLRQAPKRKIENADI
jgi:predicted transcriptional regulator